MRPRGIDWRHVTESKEEMQYVGEPAELRGRGEKNRTRRRNGEGERSSIERNPHPAPNPSHLARPTLCPPDLATVCSASPRCDPALGFTTVRRRRGSSRKALGLVTETGVQGGVGSAGAHEGPGAPHQGGASASAAGDRAAGRQGAGRRALHRAVRLVVLPPRQCQPKES